MANYKSGPNYKVNKELLTIEQIINCGIFTKRNNATMNKLEVHATVSMIFPKESNSKESRLHDFIYI